MSGTLVVRPPAVDEGPALAGVLGDMVAHYGQSVPSARMDEAVAMLLRPSRAGPFALVAVREDGFVGIALFGEAFPAFALTRGLFLRDVWVSEAARGRGIGRALMAGLGRFARAHGHTRIEWRTGRDNLPAQRLYAAIGAPPTDAVYYRLEGADLDRLAAG
ncbi:MAG: GNAT family N-acetyltransferase [Alphaproteobacteria bacterium]|nr:GNAT family N-acetyltransferase [Alphaproteobacteria bacterium]